MYNCVMDLILAPGNSSRNKEWIEEVSEGLKDLFGKRIVQYYKHWETGGKLLDFNLEYRRLVESASSLTEYCIFAKSAGVLNTLRGIYNADLKPKGCILVGSAIYMGKKLGFGVEKWLSSVEIPVLFIQKEQDPAYSFENLEKMVLKSGIKNFTLAKIPGDDHHYGDVSLLREEILGFVGEVS